MNSWILRALIAVAVIGSLSCMKKPDMDETETPAALEDVQKSLVNSWGQADPLSMTPKDFLYSETSQQLEEQEPRVVLQEGVTVSNKNEATNDWTYTFLYQAAVINGDQVQQSTREDHRCVAKNDAGCPTNAADSSDSSSASLPSTALSLTNTSGDNIPVKSMAVDHLKAMMNAAELKPYDTDNQMTLGIERFYDMAYACKPPKDLQKLCKEKLGGDSCEIRCSNLRTSEEVVDAPPLMKDQPNCAGLPNCQIHLNRVSFDWLFVMKVQNVTQKQKVNYTIAFSPDMPFLSRMMEYCQRGLITLPQTGNKYLVSICNRVKNFKRGTN